MIKREELKNPDSCFNRAKPDEMTFVLLGRDKAAPFTIRAWAKERIRLGKNVLQDEQIQRALLDATFLDGQDPAIEVTEPDVPEVCESCGCDESAYDHHNKTQYGSDKPNTYLHEFKPISVEQMIINKFCGCDMKAGHTCDLHGLLDKLRKARQ